MRSRGPYQTAALLAAALVIGCQSGPDQGAGTPSEDLSSDAAAAGTGTNEAEPAPAAAIDWAALGDCRAQLRRLLQLAEDGPAPDPKDLPFVAVIQAGEEGWLSPRASYLRADLPISVHRRHDGKARSAPCLIEIGPAHDVDAQEQTIGTEQVRSAYQTGTRSENNPEYDVAKARVRQAERRAKDAEGGVLEVGDPLLDLVGLLVGGVLSGFEEYDEEEELDRALAELARTPKKLDQPKHRAYHFERTTVRAAKAAVIPVTLVDRRRERSWRVELRQRELREFHLLDGLDPRDRHYEQHRKGSMTRAELESWNSRPPPIDLSTALAAVLDPPSGRSTLATGRGDLQFDQSDAEREAEPAAPPPRQSEPEATLESVKGPQTAAQDEPLRLAADYRPAGDEVKGAATAGDRQGEVDRLAAVVKVTAGDRKGSGVYVDRHLVLTSYQLVQGAVVIDVGTADGETVAGLLEDADPGRDLALVQVPRTGSPIAWRAGARLPSSSLVEVLYGARMARTARIEADGDAVRVHIDGERPSGLFGAPVFLGGEAIGMVSALGDAGGGTLSAVAAEDIARFLGGEPGTLATH